MKKKKYYISPQVAVIHMATTAVLAGSGELRYNIPDADDTFGEDEEIA